MDTKDAAQIIEHTSKSINFTPYETRWIPCSAKFVALGSSAKGAGVLNIYELGKTELTTVQEIETDSGFLCGTFGASSYESRHLATGNMNGMLQIYDLDHLPKPIYSTKAHDTLVNCIDGVGGLNIGHGAPELVTGSRDGTVKIWDPRQPDYVASIEPAPGQKPRDCWAVAFGNSFNADERVVAAGYDNGDIKLLDLRTNQISWETNVLNGVVDLEFDRKDIEMNKLLVTTLENKLRVYDTRTLHPESGYASVVEKAHKSTVWSGKHLPQNREIFMTGGGNGTVNLWKYQYPAQRTKKDENGIPKGVPGTLQAINSKLIAQQPIISWDWHQEKLGLACMCALDQTIKVMIVTKLNNY